MREVISELETRLPDATAKGLAQAVTRAIRDGVLAPGDRLPPIRELGHELALSPTTISAAWAMLVRAGTIKTGGRRGTVISDLRSPGEVRYRQTSDELQSFAYDLSTGAPDPALLPDIAAAMRRAAQAPPRLGYTDVPILPELQDLLLDQWPLDSPTLAITDGAVDALELVIRTNLQFGDRVIVEDPTLRALVDLLEAAGVVIVGVPVDAEGMEPAALRSACAEPVDAVFLQLRSQNPTGVSMTTERAAAVAEILGDTEALVVEDDSTGVVSDSPELTLGAYLPERTVYIRSFSKSHGPDLRLAAMSGPDDVMARVRHARRLGQGWTSWLLQRVLVELLTDTSSQSAVAAARAEYARRQRVFAEAMHEHGLELLGHDGLNAWIPVEDEAAALMRLAAAGIAVAPGHLFAVGIRPQAHVRVTVGLLGEDLERVAAHVARAATASLSAHAR